MVIAKLPAKIFGCGVRPPSQSVRPFGSPNVPAQRSAAATGPSGAPGWTTFRLLDAQVLHEACIRYHPLWFYAELETNHVAQEIVNNVPIAIRTIKSGEFGEYIFMQFSNCDDFSGLFVGDLDVEYFSTAKTSSTASSPIFRPTFDMSGGQKGAKRPFGRPLDGRVSAHFPPVAAYECRGHRVRPSPRPSMTNARC